MSGFFNISGLPETTDKQRKGFAKVETAGGEPLPMSKPAAEQAIAEEKTAAQEGVLGGFFSGGVLGAKGSKELVEEPGIDQSLAAHGMASKIVRNVLWGYTDEAYSLLPDDLKAKLIEGEAYIERESPTAKWTSSGLGLAAGSRVGTLPLAAKGLTLGTKGALATYGLMRGGSSTYKALRTAAGIKPGPFASNVGMGFLTAQEMDSWREGLLAGALGYGLGFTGRKLVRGLESVLKIDEEAGLGNEEVYNKLMYLYRHQKEFEEVRRNPSSFFARWAAQYDPDIPRTPFHVAKESTEEFLNKAAVKTRSYITRLKGTFGDMFDEAEKKMVSKTAGEGLNTSRIVENIDKELEERFNVLTRTVTKDGKTRIKIAKNAAQILRDAGVDPAILEVRRMLIPKAATKKSPAIITDLPQVIRAKRILARSAGPNFGGLSKSAGFSRYVWNMVDDELQNTLAASNANVAEYVAMSQRYSKARGWIDDYDVLFPEKAGSQGFKPLRGATKADDKAAGDYKRLIDRFADEIDVGDSYRNKVLKANFMTQSAEVDIAMTADRLLEVLPHNHAELVGIFSRLERGDVWHPMLQVAAERSPKIARALDEARLIAASDEFFGAGLPTSQGAAATARAGVTMTGQPWAGVSRGEKMTQAPAKKLAKMTYEQPEKFRRRVFMLNVDRLFKGKTNYFTDNPVTRSFLTAAGLVLPKRGQITARLVATWKATDEGRRKLETAKLMYEDWKSRYDKRLLGGTEESKK